MDSRPGWMSSVCVNCPSDSDIFWRQFLLRPTARKTKYTCDWLYKHGCSWHFVFNFDAWCFPQFWPSFWERPHHPGIGNWSQLSRAEEMIRQWYEYQYYHLISASISIGMRHHGSMRLKTPETRIAAPPDRCLSRYSLGGHRDSQGCLKEHIKQNQNDKMNKL